MDNVVATTSSVEEATARSSGSVSTLSKATAGASKDTVRTSQATVAAVPTPQQASGDRASPLAAGTGTQAATSPSLKAPQNVVRAATASFVATTSSQIALKPNDLVEIVERHSSGWTYGRKVSPTVDPSGAIEGWFPDWVCGQK